MFRWKTTAHIRYAGKQLAYSLLAMLAVTTAARAGALFGLVGNPGVDVEGFGFFGNIALMRSLEILEPQEESLTEFDSIFIEDAIWILSGEVKRRGYLYPEIGVSVYRDSAEIWDGEWEEDILQTDIPQDLVGDHVIFDIREGLLFYYDTITVEGLPDEIKRPVESFFYPIDRLYISEGDRFFTPGRLQSSLDAILGYLRDHGYRQAKVVQKDYEDNRETGAVAVSATIEPGAILFVDQLVIKTPTPLPATGSDPPQPPIKSETIALPDQRFTPAWLLSKTYNLRKRYFKAGYPDVTLHSDFKIIENPDQTRTLKVTLKIDPGEKIELSGVKFEGAGSIETERLKEQAKLDTGEALDRLAVEEGRDRLGRLGAFQSISINYEDTGPGQRDAIYELTLKKQTIINLIFGVGSFDIVRGGFEIIQNNLWGLAHRSSLTAIQSLKATYVDYTYLIPQLFAEDVDFFLKANYLRREEISFLRVEYGGQAGVQHFFPSINTSASAAYSYGLVDAKDTEFLFSPGPRRALVSSIYLRANRSELDNPVFPTDGWQVFGTSEFALPQLGGQVEYQRFEVGGAWHHPIDDGGLVFHAGLKHGVVTSFGPADENIPVAKRFFLGGENTVRGYRRDQASPVNAQGQQIGAVSYVLLQLELEQRLSEMFSVVAFVDSVGNAAQISEYPFNDVLMSVGGGISIRTVVGPLRFEYGHNVKKRPNDPSGTFQFALGFPF